MHHGVRIKDSALVAAAIMSNRYISDRFLPDKAIDLVDEAAARLRTEIDSMPAELDETRRRIMQLEIEREALRKETDKVSRERLDRLEKELADLRAESDALMARWQQEKSAVQRVRTLREQIDQVKVEIAQAERNYDLNKAAELKYGRLIELERQLNLEQERISGKVAVLYWLGSGFAVELQQTSLRSRPGSSPRADAPGCPSPNVLRRRWNMALRRCLLVVVLASVFAFAPIFVANVVFSRSFRDTTEADSAFASNLLGIAVGGVVEYAALATGTQALLIPVMAFYAAALFFGRRIISARA